MISHKIQWVKNLSRIRTFQSFQHRDFRFVWANTLFFSAGFWLQQIVIGWLTYELTQSALLTTLSMGIDALPVLLIGPLGGLLADSWDRRKLLVCVSLYQSVITMVFAVAVISELVGPLHIFGYVLLMGLGWVILDPVRPSLVSIIVPRETLINAFALNALGFSVTRLAAPAIGGGLLAVFGPGPVLLIESGMQMLAGVAAYFIQIPARKRQNLQIKKAFIQILEGIRYVKRHPIILRLVILSFIPPLMSFPFLNGLMPVFAAEVFKVGSVGLGLLMSSLGVGSVLGTLVLASIGTVNRKGRLIILSVGVTALTMLLFSQITAFYFAFPVLLIASIGQMVFFSTSSALVQTIVNDEYRGRVTSLSMFSFGMMPVGSLAAGSLAQRMGAPFAMLTASVTIAVVLIVFLIRSRLLWGANQ